MNYEIEEQIKQVLSKIRPFINRDGGDFEFIKFEEGVVYIKMLGACIDCMLVDSTIKDGIEAMLIEEVQGVEQVIAV